MIISTNKCRAVLIIKLLTIIKEKPQYLGFPLLISGDSAIHKNASHLNLYSFSKSRCVGDTFKIQLK